MTKPRDTTGKRKSSSRAGKRPAPITVAIVAPDTAPQWVKDRAAFYTQALRDIQQRRQLHRLPHDAPGH